MRNLIEGLILLGEAVRSNVALGLNVWLCLGVAIAGAFARPVAYQVERWRRRRRSVWFKCRCGEEGVAEDDSRVRDALVLVAPFCTSCGAQMRFARRP